MQDEGSIYRQILDHISEIVYQVDGNPLTGGVVFVSKQVEEILGYRAEEFIQDPTLWFQLLHPEDVSGVMKSTQQLVATRAPVLRVYRLRHKATGAYPWFEDKVVPQVDAQGQVTGIWGVARDTTWRMHQRAQRRALRQVEKAVWRMETPDDIEQVLGVLYEALGMAEVPFRTCGINILDTASDPPKVCLYTIDGRETWQEMSLAGAEVILQIWHTGEPAYRQDLEKEDPYQERAAIERGFGYPVRSVIDIPFSHGTLAVNSPQPEAFSDAHLAFLQELAHVLGEGFRRLDDLRGLAQSEARYRTLVETPAWVVALVGQQGACRYISPQIEAWTGYAPEEFYRDAAFCQSIIHPEDVARVEHALRQALQGSTPQEVEFRWKCKRGDLRWVSGAVFPIFDQAKKVEGAQIVLQDITTRKEAKKALHEVNSLLERQLRFTEHLYRMRARLTEAHTPEQVITCVGQMLVKMGEGITPLEVAIEYDNKIWHFGQAPAGAFYVYERALAWGGHHRGQVCLRCAQPLCELEKQTFLEETATQLAQVLEARELELQLLQSSRLVSLGQMAAGVAHELYQPLTAISTTAEDIYLRLLDHLDLPPPQLREMMKDVLELVERMGEVIEQLRAFSRDTAQEPGSRFSLNAVVPGALRLIRAQLQGHDIQVVLALAEDLPLVEGHLHQLEQVLLNLLANACDALDERQVGDIKQVVVRTCAQGEQVVLEVTDNGVGMAEEVRLRVFEPFFTTKQVDRGTGLGLSISYGIVRNHQGQISCDSRMGQGTTFQITLPAVGHK